MSLEDKSVKEYQAKIKTIFKKYGGGQVEAGISAQLDACFKEILNAGLSTKTVKKYRAVIYWYAELKGVDLKKNNYAIDFESRDSGKRQAYELDKRIKMIANIEKVSSGYREFVYLNLICGALIGYRMSEIPSLKIKEYNDDKFFIEIKNGKATNGRGLGAYRGFWLARYFGNFDLCEIIERLRNIAVSYEDFDRYLASASVAHGRVAAKIFTDCKPPVMSGMRHQFKLNLLAGGLSELEVSALMGHISDLTHKRNYGRKTKRSGTPSPQEVEFCKEVEVAQDLVSKVRLVSEKQKGYGLRRGQGGPKM